MDESKKEEILEHLTACPLCADAVLLFHDLRFHPQPEAPLAFDPEQAWSAFQERRAETSLGPEKSPSKPASKTPDPLSRVSVERLVPLWRRLGFAYGLAAAILAAALLVLWTDPDGGVFGPSTGRFSEIEANPRIVTLAGIGQATRSGRASQSLNPARPMVLFLPTSLSREYEKYHLQILDHQGRVVLENGDLIPDELGSFIFFLRSDSLASGNYRIFLFAIADGRRELLEKFPLGLATEENAP